MQETSSVKFEEFIIFLGDLVREYITNSDIPGIDKLGIKTKIFHICEKSADMEEIYLRILNCLNESEGIPKEMIAKLKNYYNKS